ncbi:MAG: metal ABC transporter substrate-binding protein, partial [Oscillospiraceae bacterium]|nr:metal ABC transporter substrate-binding protein [Oscillospiraceae bacterium]
TVFSGCKNIAKGADNGKINVVSTIFAPYDFARQVVGDKANLKMLLPPGSESHSYEPTPQDIITIEKCDVFIYVGGDSDEWVKEILSSIDMKDKQVVTLMDCVETVEEEVVEGMEDAHEHEGEEHSEEEHTDEHTEEEHSDEHAEEEHSDEHADEDHEHEGELDEHVWTSPRNAKLITQKISDAIQAEDTANAETYKKNTTDYLAKLDELDNKFKEVVANGTRTEIIMGDRFPFRYFADAYGLSYYAAFTGCSTETEASAATISFLIDKTAKDEIPIIFHIELSNEKIAKTVAEGAKDKNGGKDVKVLLLHSCHNVTKSDFEGGATYLTLMEKNVETLKTALS